MGYGKYILDGHETKEEPDLLTWARWYEAHAPCSVARTGLEGGATVSTVFLGVDHRHFAEGPPLLFETATFGGPRDGELARCSTWDEAERQHSLAVAIAAAARDLQRAGES